MFCCFLNCIVSGNPISQSIIEPLGDLTSETLISYTGIQPSMAKNPPLNNLYYHCPNSSLSKIIAAQPLKQVSAKYYLKRTFYVPTPKNSPTQLCRNPARSSRLLRIVQDLLPSGKRIHHLL